MIPIHLEPLNKRIIQHISNIPCELIIKPTEACNFKCTFCSSTEISNNHYQILDLQYIFDFLKKYPKTNTIIVNGGDPLMVKPKYYWKIIDYLDNNQLPATLSFTSNLWGYYKNPQQWIELFNNKRVGVTTSFHYGDTRKITDKRIFTDKDFWLISNMFYDDIGYRPDFISVITDDNEQFALDNVKLAKQMNVECKLNYAMSSGNQNKPYQLSKIYKLYIDVYKAGLTQWEYNTKQMINRIRNQQTTCPQARSCDTYIRALNPGGDYYSCGSFGDDKDKSIDFTQEIYNGNHFTPLSDDVNLLSMKTDCLTCDMFNICNGCRKTIKDLKNHNMVEQHCQLMKKLAPTIIEIGQQ